MANNPSDPQRPQPPQRPVAPLPPGFVLREPAARPETLMDFMARRLESLERELAVERERAMGAQSLLAHQDSLRGEVEAQMKAMSEQLRREKSDRDAEERKVHAQGRIETLELRLDEMHQTWSQLLKEALARRDAPADPGASSGLSDGISELNERASALERHLRLEQEKQEERMRSLAHDNAALREALEEQGRGLRLELGRERAEQERRLRDELGALRAGQEKAGALGDDLKNSMDSIASRLAASPQAKDAILEAARQEKEELLAALDERREALRRFMEERRSIEATLAENLAVAEREKAQEMENGHALRRRVMELEVEISTWKDKLAGAEERHKAQEERLLGLGAERDGLAKHLLEEAGKVKAQIDARRQAEQNWAREIEALQKKSHDLAQERLNDGSALADLRGQLATLAQQLAGAVREKEELQARYAVWDQERRQLLESLGKKDEMVSLFSTTFQNFLKKS